MLIQFSGNSTIRGNLRCLLMLAILDPQFSDLGRMTELFLMLKQSAWSMLFCMKMGTRPTSHFTRRLKISKTHYLLRLDWLYRSPYLRINVKEMRRGVMNCLVMVDQVSG